MKVFKANLVAKDNRGMIVRLMDFARKHNFKTALYIKSKTDSIRANHYHKRDTHYTCLISGQFKYFEKRLTKKAKTISRIINPGDIVVSYPNFIHAMRFTEASEMVVFTTESRSQTKYEKDTVRIKLV
jgi:dTDP-4-dehydrorhamnose 3,5-epimerase-like enzyme